MFTDALGVAYNVSYLEKGWQLTCTVVVHLIFFTYGALLNWGNFLPQKHIKLLSGIKLFLLSDLLPSARKLKQFLEF